MKRDRDQVEAAIIKMVRESSTPPEMDKVVKTVSNGARVLGDKTTRRAIRSLIDRGLIQVTLDWKLKA
jgi:hypothetical protein